MNKRNLLKNIKRGFTLIELLVVVAIIGVLASVVLASLNSARAKGTDAAIKANLANLRAQAEIYYDSVGSYKGTATAFVATATQVACQTANSVFNITAGGNGIGQGVKGASDAFSTTWSATCALGDATHDSWAVSVTLKAGGSWCVDSTGAAKAGVAAGGNTANAACP